MVINDSTALPDFYAMLQVAPGADPEVIEAAYRQLMKKHHPDVAGEDPAQVAAHHARAKAINQAFSVLRDPEQRRRYDAERERFGTRRPSEPTWRHSARPQAPPRPRPDPAPEPSSETAPPAEPPVSPPATDKPPTLLGLIAAAYYLLPGAYEWEASRRRELIAVGLLPVLTIAGFCLATGRLAPFIGHSLNATALAAVMLLLASLLLWQMLPRIAMAGLPSLGLASGALDPVIQQAHMPAWLAWGLLSLLSLVLSARLYVFAVLPALGACWIIAHVSS